VTLTAVELALVSLTVIAYESSHGAGPSQDVSLASHALVPLTVVVQTKRCRDLRVHDGPVKVGCDASVGPFAARPLAVFFAAALARVFDKMCAPAGSAAAKPSVTIAATAAPRLQDLIGAPNLMQQRGDLMRPGQAA
jgi:hypothetical protein